MFLNSQWVFDTHSSVRNILSSREGREAYRTTHYPKTQYAEEQPIQVADRKACCSLPPSPRRFRVTNAHNMTPRILIVHLVLLSLLAWAAGHCSKLIGNGSSKSAARCVYRGRMCTAADAGTVCAPWRRAEKQKWICRAHACAYCKCHPDQWLCQQQLFDKACNFSNGAPMPASHWASGSAAYTDGGNTGDHGHGGRNNNGRWAPHHEPEPTASDLRKCTRLGTNGHVVIPAAQGSTTGWFLSHNCLVWKRSRNSRSIDPPGSGEICYDFRVDKASRYYFTANTMAPHVTEHNDMWVRFRQGGFRLYKPESDQYDGWYQYGWLKAYQNKGGNLLSNQLRTVDFDGHQFETPILRPGRIYSVCISGRSSKFSVCKLHLVACTRRECTNWRNAMQSTLSHLHNSPCAW